MRTFLPIFLVGAAVMAATGSTITPAPGTITDSTHNAAPAATIASALDTIDDVTLFTDTITIMHGPCNPCLNGGMFLESENGYNCFCANGFTGNKCQTAVNNTRPCPTGYSRGPDNHCYHYNATHMKVTDAQAYCASTNPGAYVVEINSGIENNHVQKMISSHAWLGGRRLSGTWTWTHSGLVVSRGYTNWVSGIPTAWGDCMFIDLSKWVNDVCATLSEVVCEYGN